MTRPRPADNLPRAVPARRQAHMGGLALDRAVNMVCMVRDEGRCATGEFLDRLNRQDLYALTVALAAMVPDDLPVEELLAWVDPDADPAVAAA